MDQPELFQAANLGDLDVLLRAFNLDPWRKRKQLKIVNPCLCNCTEKGKTILLWIQKKGLTRRPKGHGETTQGNSYRQRPDSVQIQKHKVLYVESRLGSKEEPRDTKTNQDARTVWILFTSCTCTQNMSFRGFCPPLAADTHRRNLLMGHVEKESTASDQGILTVSELSPSTPPFTT